MSKSRFILKAAKVSGSAASDLTRYIAKSKLDQEREGTRPRPLFDENRDDLTFWQARKYLSISGGALVREDVLHYILSFKRPKDYENLGTDDHQRTAQVRAFLRHALSEAAAKLGIETWRWAAGVHLNEPNPHIHLLINKYAIGRESRELVRVLKLTKPLVAHNQKAEGKTGEFDYGTILTSFATSVDERIRECEIEREKSRVKQLENERAMPHYTLNGERLLLAKAMLTSIERDRLERIIFALQKSHNPPSEQLSKLNQRLETARNYHASLAPQVELMRARYREKNTPLPTPALSSVELNKLQDAAIEARDAERVRAFEKIRQVLAGERKTPIRNAHEQGRLQAQLREAEADATFQAWREKRFERSFHLYRFAIAGERWSLAGVDARIENERIKTSFIRVGIAAFLPSQRKSAQAEIGRLGEIRKEVLERVLARDKELENERANRLHTVAALREIDARETRPEAADKPYSIYTRAELDRLEFRARAMHDGGLLLEVHEARRTKDERLAPEKRTLLEARTSQDAVRARLAESDFAEVRQAHDESARRNRFMPVATRLSDGSIITGSVRQTEVLSRADALIRIFENTSHTAERENAIRRAAAVRASENRADYEAAASYLAAARHIAAESLREFARNGKQLPDSRAHEQVSHSIDPLLSHSIDPLQLSPNDAFGSVERRAAQPAQEIQGRNQRTLDAPLFTR